MNDFNKKNFLNIEYIERYKSNILDKYIYIYQVYSKVTYLL
jgi:hypothetical protein